MAPARRPQKTTRRDPIPAWWWRAIREARETYHAAGGSDSDLAAEYSGHAKGTSKHQAAKNMVSKFFSGAIARNEFASFLSERLRVPFYVFYAQSLEEAQELHDAVTRVRSLPPSKPSRPGPRARPSAG